MKDVNIKIFNKDGDIIFDKNYIRHTHEFGTVLISKIQNIAHGSYGHDKSDCMVISYIRGKKRKSTLQKIIDFLFKKG